MYASNETGFVCVCALSSTSDMLEHDMTCLAIHVKANKHKLGMA